LRSAPYTLWAPAGVIKFEDGTLDAIAATARQRFPLFVQVYATRCDARAEVFSHIEMF